MVEEALARNPALLAKALLLAASTSRTFHHGAYVRACVHALAGDGDAAVTWMETTVKAGMPIYPAFVRDTCFDGIRRSAPFTRFMTVFKPVWDEYERRMR